MNKKRMKDTYKKQMDLNATKQHISNLADKAFKAACYKPGGNYIFLLSLGDSSERCQTHCIATTCQTELKDTIAKKLTKLVPKQGLTLKLEVIQESNPVPWGQAKEVFAKTKRNYFNLGIAFHEDLHDAIPNGDICGWALLYSSESSHATPRNDNLSKYLNYRGFDPREWPDDPGETVYFFSTKGFVITNNTIHTINNHAPYAGYRTIHEWPFSDELETVIHQSTAYLSNQVNEDGLFFYGRWPCFNKRINTYNTLRHFSSSYSILEGWEITQDKRDLAAAKRAIDFGISCFSSLRDIQVSGETVSARFIVETNGELKLGACAHAVLATSKYTELTGDDCYTEIISQLTYAIIYFQQATTHGFAHVLHLHDLSIKELSRIIYYDGEALFALCRAYAVNNQWDHILKAAFIAADHFIESEHWRAHDHWLGYAYSSLYKFLPHDKYLVFGLLNIRDHIDFIEKRITTYPTLLELCMATKTLLLESCKQGKQNIVSEYIDIDKFYSALNHRARYLLNGFFWPETAMHFKKPQTILGSFYIRHHAFRSRIDDNEHYISGLVAYLKAIKHSPTSDFSPSS